MSLGWPGHSCALRLGTPQGSVAEQGCEVQPGSCYILQAAPVSGSFGPLRGGLSAHGRPCLVSPPWGQLHNCADTLLPTSTCTWGTSTLGAPVGWGVGRGKGSQGSARAKEQAGTSLPYSPLQLRAPACSAPLAPLSHLYTCADTCTNTSQIIKVYQRQCLWFRSFCQWHIAHHSAWGALAVQVLLASLPATPLYLQLLLTQPGGTLGHVLLLHSLMMSIAEPP